MTSNIILLLKQNSFYFADDILIYNFEFVLILHMQLSYLKINLKSSSAKYRPYCLCLGVLTHCSRDKVISILQTTFFNFISNFRWNLNKIYILEMTVMFQLLCFEGETKWCPFQEINYPVWNWFIVFFIFNFSAFLNFHTQIYCIIVSSCTEKGSNAVHRMTSLLGNVFPNAAPMCGPWVTVGCLHKGPVIQRCTCPRLIPFALFLLLTSVKRHPLSNNKLPVIKFRVGYVHLSLILILKNRKYHKEIAKNMPWLDNACAH